MKVYKFSLIFLNVLLFNSNLFSQNCECNRWKRTTFDNSGNPIYNYRHGCDQYSSEYEFVGYDESYCKQLIENEKRRLEDIKNTKEAIEISKNTIKQQYKDGYTVLEWWGEFLGNTGKWDNVGSPRYGVKEDSSFVQWNENGAIEIRGKIKNKELNGLLEIYEFDDGYLDPTSFLREIRAFFNIGIDWNWKPNYIYFNDIDKFEFEGNSKNIGIEKTFYGIYYSKNNGQKKYYSHYFIKDGFVTLFTDAIDEKKANVKHYLIDSVATKKELKTIIDKLTILKNKLALKKITEFNLNEIQKNSLDKKESDFTGTWSFLSNSNFQKSSDGYADRIYFLTEDYTFNKDRTYQYNGKLIYKSIHNGQEIQKNPEIVFNIVDNGYWEMNETKLLLYSIDSSEIKFEKFKEKYSKKITDLLLMLNSSDIKNSYDNAEWVELKEIRQKILASDNDVLTLFKCFVDESDYYYETGINYAYPSNNLKKLLYSLEKEKKDLAEMKIVDLREIHFDIIKSNKANTKEIIFKNTLLYKNLELPEDELPTDYYERINHKKILDYFSKFTFTLKGKKQ